MLFFNISNILHKNCMGDALMVYICQYCFSNMTDLGWYMCELRDKNQNSGPGRPVNALNVIFFLFFIKICFSSTCSTRLIFTAWDHEWSFLIARGGLHEMLGLIISYTNHSTGPQRPHNAPWGLNDIMWYNSGSLFATFVLKCIKS